jgi:hypothetical protein
VSLLAFFGWVFYCQPSNKVAMTHPAAVTACNLDLENLITGKNEEEFFL